MPQKLHTIPYKINEKRTSSTKHACFSDTRVKSKPVQGSIKTLSCLTPSLRPSLSPPPSSLSLWSIKTGSRANQNPFMLTPSLPSPHPPHPTIISLSLSLGPQHIFFHVHGWLSERLVPRAASCSSAGPKEAFAPANRRKKSKRTNASGGDR